MKKYKSVFILILIICLMPKMFSNTSVNFSSDISGEFPNLTSYNNFVNTLSNGFKTAIMHQRNMRFFPYILAQSYINEEVPKFNFGINTSFGVMDLSLKNKGSFSDALKYSYGDYTNVTAGFSIYFGFPVHQNLFLFFDIGLASGEGIPFGVSLLWKIMNYKNLGTISKLFLSLSTSFSFINIYKFNRRDYSSMPLEGQYTVNSSDEKIYIMEAVPHDIKHFSFTSDMSIKYTLTYEWFNVHLALGIGIQVFNASRKYNLNTNVDYVGSGSPTGVNSSAIVDFNEKWITFLPHFDVGFSFQVTKWLRLPYFMFGFYINPVDKRLYVNFSCNVVFLF